MAYSNNAAIRTIEEDDINAFWMGNPGELNVLANRSFEYATHFAWGFLPSGNGGSYTRYCDPPNAFSGSCFVQFNGNGLGGASMFQEVLPRGPGATYLTPSIRVRNDSGGSLTVTLALHIIDLGTAYNVNCNPAPGGGWTICSLPRTYVGATNLMRFQVYNYGGGNISIDLGEMRANDCC